MKTTTKLVLVVVSVLTLGLLGLAKSPSVQAIPGDNGILCANEGRALCLAVHHTDVITVNFNGGYVLNKHRDRLCGGTNKVDGNGSNCPFRSGSGLNSRYKNDRIVTFATAGGCIGVDTHNLTVLRDCPGHGHNTNGTAWVQDGRYGLVNVYGSNRNSTNSHGWYLCSTGVNGNNAVVTPWVAGACQWAF